MIDPKKKPHSLRWNILGLIIAWLSPLPLLLAITIALSYEGPPQGDSILMLVLTLCLIPPYFGCLSALLLCLQGGWKMRLAVVIPLIINFIISCAITHYLISELTMPDPPVSEDSEVSW